VGIDEAANWSVETCVLFNGAPISFHGAPNPVNGASFSFNEAPNQLDGSPFSGVEATLLINKASRFGSGAR
jgi:hypothetical protein